MAYAFNDDKSKFNFGNWTQLVSITTGVVRGKVYYKVTSDGEVTLKFNLDLYGAFTAGTGVILFPLSALPTEIKPKGTNDGGLGLYMQSPMYMLSHNNAMSAKRCAFGIIPATSGHGLDIRIFDAIDGTSGQSNGYYIHSEWKYNTVI